MEQNLGLSTLSQRLAVGVVRGKPGARQLQEPRSGYLNP